MKWEVGSGKWEMSLAVETVPRRPAGHETRLRGLGSARNVSQPWLRVAVLALVAFLVACGGAAPTATTIVPQPSATAVRVSSAPSVAGASVAASAAPAGSVAPGASPTRAVAPATPGVSGVATPGTPVGTPRGTTYPLTITDDAGRSVTVPKRPVRIVSLAPSNTEILYALGLGDRVVGVDQFSNYPPEAQSKPKIGSYSAANLEQVVAREPDLILASGITRPDVLTALSAQGLPVVALNPSDLTGVLENITLVGRLTDVGASAGQLRAGLEARIAAVTEKLKGTSTKPRVFVEIDPMQFFSVGPKSFVDDLITRAGGVNIAADTGTPYPQLSQEQILAKDPEVILLADGSQGVTPVSVQGRAGWGNVSAVKSGRIVVLDEDVFLRSGPRSVDALEMLLRYLHPELFR